MVDEGERVGSSDSGPLALLRSVSVRTWRRAREDAPAVISSMTEGDVDDGGGFDDRAFAADLRGRSLRCAR